MKKVYIVLGVIILGIVGFVIWEYQPTVDPVVVEETFIPLTPEERRDLIKNLEVSSAPPKPVKEREVTLNKLEASSAPVTSTVNERLERLKALEAASKK